MMAETTPTEQQPPLDATFDSEMRFFRETGIWTHGPNAEQNHIADVAYKAWKVSADEVDHLEKRIAEIEGVLYRLRPASLAATARTEKGGE